LIDHIWVKEEIYGKGTKSTPDIVFGMAEDYSYSHQYPFEGIIRPANVGDHAIDGIFIAYGDKINKNKKVVGAEIVDLAPTILHMFGIPIPKDMDGKVLSEIFKKGSEFDHKIVYEKRAKNKLGKDQFIDDIEV